MPISAQNVVEAYKRLKYPLSQKTGHITIFYGEGLNIDGTINNDAPDKWNDVRGTLKFVNGVPQIIKVWQATTEPGKKYTLKPINSKGAARIACPSYYRVWKVGIHNNDHRALLQRGGPIVVHRDKNKDYERKGDIIDPGNHGINQHWGYDISEASIQGASAGCLVGRTKNGHIKFMKIIESDTRYIADKNYVFDTAIFPASMLIGSP